MDKLFISVRLRTLKTTYSKYISNMSKKSKSKTKAINVKENTEEPSPISLSKTGNVCIKVLAKPGAKLNCITDISVDGIGVQINAPPVDGDANTELIKYLASILNLRKTDISLERGSRSRNKTILASNTTVEDVTCKIKLAIQNG
ncbi:UPF0235 protein C15orf40 homolog [Ctenocephalides felis]|uniref:UPF0235 protein C15orf40 homolog n=1 Tax=Ctenocephalides felis TaxID=7515 RepID=UPI000E6E4251|nr:UPF0235 protein C15orf40 homolog [Ctenocephalides felis]